MIRKFILAVSILFPFFSLSKGEESIQKWWVIKDSVSKSIHKDSIRLVVRVYDFNGLLMLDQHPVIVQARVDNKTRKHTVSKANTGFQYDLRKGKHLINFYLNPNFEQISFDRDFTTGGRYLEIGITFPPTENNNRPVQIMLEKPVIYLYSETDQEFELKLKTGTDIQFTYPVYENGWKGTTAPDGTIRINQTSYPYLFWDAALSTEHLNPDWRYADCIPGSEIVKYLDQQLESIGFNAKEKTDFITYWAPRIQKMSYVQLLWMQNETINPLASLDITPSFKQNRIYLLFRETDHPVEQTLELKIKPLIRIDRSGNSLVEWGGIEIQSTL